jgi:hypothetical protein
MTSHMLCEGVVKKTENECYNSPNVKAKSAYRMHNYDIFLAGADVLAHRETERKSKQRVGA